MGDRDYVRQDLGDEEQFVTAVPETLSEEEVAALSPEERAVTHEMTGAERELFTEDARQRAEEAQYDTWGGEAVAAGASFVDTALFGGGSALLRTISPELAAEIAKYREYSGVGEVAGTLGGLLVPAILSGGTGALAGASRFTAGGLAAGAGRAAEGFLASRGLGGAFARAALSAGVEGAVDGAANAITQSVVNQDPLSAERLASQIGLGALLGVGAGGLLAGGKKAAAVAAKRFAAKADDAVLSGARRVGAAVDSMSTKIDNLYTAPRAGNAVTPEMAPMVAEGTRTLKQATVESLDTALNLGADDAAKKVALAQPEIKALKKVRSIISGIDDSSDDIVKLRASLEQAQGKVRKELAALPDRSTGRRILETEDAKLDRYLSDESIWSTPQVQMTKSMREYEVARRDFQEAAAIADPRAMSLDTAALPELQKKATRLADAANVVITNAEQAGVPAAALTQAKAAAAKARRVAAPSAAAMGVGSIVQGRVKSAIGGVGTAIGAGIGGGPGAIVGAMAGKFLADKASTKIAGMFNLAGVEQLYAQSLRQGSRAFKKLDKVLSGSAAKALASTPGKLTQRLSSSSAAERRKNYKELIDDLRSAASSPAEMAQHLAETLAPIGDTVSDTLTTEVQVWATNAANHLVSKLPPLDLYEPLFPFEKMDPPQVEIDQFQDRMAVVENPFAAVEALADGLLTPEAAETLSVVYPGITTEIRTKVTETLAGAREAPPYKVRVQIGTLLGLPTDSDLMPDSIRRYQNTYSQTAQQAQTQLSPRHSPNLASSQMTRLQQAEKL